jgi:hypothetical protein
LAKKNISVAPFRFFASVFSVGDQPESQQKTKMRSEREHVSHLDPIINPDEEGTSLKSRLLAIFAYTTLWGSLILIITGLLVTLGPNSVFVWHPVCMTLAFVGFMGHAILAYRAPYAQRHIYKKRFAHAFFQFGMAFSAVLGVTIILINKLHIVNHSIVPSTYHAYMAVATLGAIALQLLVGIIKFALLPRSNVLLRLHGYFGLLVFVSTFATMSMGMWSVSALSTLRYPFIAALGLFAIAVFTVRVVLPLRVDNVVTHETRSLLRPSYTD